MNIRKLVLLIIYNALIGQTIYSQVSAGSDFTICKCDGSTRLNGKYTGDPSLCVGGLKYKWTSIPTDSTLLINDTLSSPNICPKVKTKYTLTADGKTDEVEVTVNDTASDVDFKWDTLKPYGWDDWEKFGNILNSGLKDTSEVPYQSVEMGKKIKVKLNIKNLPKSYECIYFNSSDETIAKVSPEKATANIFDIEITALKKGEVDISAVLATKNGTLVKDMPKPTKLRVVVYDTIHQRVAIILVHQKDTSAGGSNYISTNSTALMTDAQFLERLDTIYKQALVKFVSLVRKADCNCNFDTNKDGKMQADTTFNTGENKIVIDSCGMKYKDSFDKIILLVDNPNDGSAGWADFNQQFVFIHVGQLSLPRYAGIDPGENAAHELGHSYGLDHAVSCSAVSNVLYQDDNNIMGYCWAGTNWYFLRYFQWKEIRKIKP